MPLYVKPEELARLKNRLASAERQSNAIKKQGPGSQTPPEKKERIVQLYKQYPSFGYVRKYAPASDDVVKAVLRDEGLI